MSVYKHIIPNIHLMLNKNLLSEEVDFEYSMKNEIIEDFKVFYNEEDSSVSFSFSTNFFPKPLRVLFIQKRIKEILELFIFNKKDLTDILIVTEETITNIIEHSYNKKDLLPIYFNIPFLNKKIIIQIEDYGKKGSNFNFNKTGNYKSLKELKENVSKSGRGMGVFLMKSIMNDIKYEPNDKKNKITMIKKIPKLNIEKAIGNSFLNKEKFTEEILVNVLEKNKDYAVISLYGYINMDTSFEIEKNVFKIKDEFNQINLIFDFKNVFYISSTGLELFMRILEDSNNNRKKICFVDMNDRVRYIFKVVGFLKYFGDVKNIKKAKEYIFKK